MTCVKLQQQSDTTTPSTTTNTYDDYRSYWVQTTEHK